MAELETGDEFADIRGRSRSWGLIGLLTIALAAVLLWRLRADVVYALLSGSPRPISLNAPAETTNRYVEVTGQPDLRNSLFIERKGQLDRRTVFRLHDTAVPFWIVAEDRLTASRLSSSTVWANRWQGRLRQLRDLPFAESLADYARKISVDRYIAPDVLRGALEKSTALHDRRKGPVAVTSETKIGVDVEVPDEFEVFAPREAGDAEAMKQALVAQKLSPVPGNGTEKEHSFLVHIDTANRNRAFAELEAAGYRVALYRVRYWATLKDLHSGELLRLDHAQIVRADGSLAPQAADSITLPWAHVHAGVVSEPVQLDGNSYVLFEGERPRSLWWAGALAGLLLFLVVGQGLTWARLSQKRI